VTIPHFIRLRPAKPEDQARKDLKRRNARTRRAAAKIHHAASRATPISAPEMTPEERREREAEFRKWWSTYFAQASDNAGEEELYRLFSAARAFMMKEIPFKRWNEIRQAFEELRAAAQPIEPVTRVRTH
jgi:hypothetical protein